MCTVHGITTHGTMIPGTVTPGTMTLGTMVTIGTIVLTATTAGTGIPGTMIHGITAAGTAPTITITATTATMAITDTTTTGTETTGMAVPVVPEDSQGRMPLAAGTVTSPPEAVQPEVPEALAQAAPLQCRYPALT